MTARTLLVGSAAALALIYLSSRSGGGGAPAVGDTFELKFTDTQGRKVDLAALKGKVVLIDFWATWCPPCVGEIPNVVEAYGKLHSKGFEILGISLDEDRAQLADFTKVHNMTWPQYCDGLGWKTKLAQRFGVRSIPTMWLVDRKGKLASTEARGNLEAEVTRLLAH